MDLDDQPDPAPRVAQWVGARRGDRARRRQRRGRSRQRADAPDMVYAMNLGLGRSDAGRPATDAVVLSHMRYAERRMETRDRAAVVRDARLRRRRTSVATASARTSRPATRSPGATRWSWATARAPRSSALKHLATELGVRVRGRADHAPGDVPPRPGLLPARRRAARWSARPRSTTPPRAALLALVPEPLVLTEEEALTRSARTRS